ncbi:hypothetical protein BKA82DRAFT_30912 [Pisolithus tinctorius]|uniref:Uncharacterized protein n=1 Tax=Pisolithus tinctorius Marx 270 TaxID=870435 RepID=A0A0C3NU29_PISTI|nr:hypothetical protein BKA82DRAFT_30912 [Pisolithus tinctorius]KIN98945.1 hypothetical protein M404DRAFT_30912 [Pisolithus tinctorius Marx 270]
MPLCDSGQLRGYLAGMADHSQGVASAVVVSASSTRESFDTNTNKALHWLFDCVTPQRVARDIRSINGFDLSPLKIHIDATNKHLPPTSQL